MYGPPESPGAYIPIKVLQHFLFNRLCQQRTNDATDKREQQNYRKRIRWVMKARGNRGHHRRHRERGNNSHQHPPEVAITIEAPPVPFQNVRRSVATIEPAHDPLRDLSDRPEPHADDDSSYQDQNGSEVAEPHQRSIASTRIDMFLVKIVDEVCCTRVHSRAEVGHE